MYFVKKSPFFLLVLLCIDVALAQQGPGGVGNATGENSQPRNVLWLDASTLGLSNDASVSSWPDQSGNGNDFGQLDSENLPIFRNDGLAAGSYDVVRFDGTERYLSLDDNTSISGLPGVSIIMVFRSTALGGPRGLVSKRLSSSSEEEYSIFTYTSDYINFDIHTNSDSRSSTDPVTVSTSTDYVFSAIYGSSSKSMFLQSAQAGSSQSKSGTISNASSPLILGALNQDYGTYFSGDIAELIMYGQGVNAAQRLLVENYLSEKYGITIANDFYSGIHQADLGGIGNFAGETHDQAASGGLIVEMYDGSFSNGEFVMAAHNESPASIVSDSLSGNAVMQERYSKSWYIDKTGSVNVALGFDFGDVIAGQYPQQASDYRLIRRNGANYEEVATSNTYVSDDQLFFIVSDANFSDGYYGLATVDNSTAPLDGGARRVWYSYKNGNWEDPLIWTLDGAATPLYVNPSSQIPSGADNVIITSGKTVNMRNAAGSADYNNVSINSMVVTGQLDLGKSYGHVFSALSGTGKIIAEGSALTDELNFALGDASAFVAQSGGTVEVQGDGLQLNTDITFNNLVLNLDGSSDVALVKSNLTLNGDMTILNGNFQINDATDANDLGMVVNGDLYVSSSGSISVGTGNSRHQFDFYGDFINDGIVAFTQRTTPTTGSEATDGIVDANFLSDDSDQNIQCNDITHFYRIEIDKGEDDTYTLNIDANDASFFNLNGYAAQGHADIDQLTSNSNALGLIKGTVRIGNNVTVGALNTGGNYNISQAARLWVDGGHVSKPGGTAIVPYGGVLVSEGTLVADINSGITTRGNGYLSVTGGKVRMNQFRTSVYGSINQGGYSQSGGEVYVTGGSTSTDYYAFSSTYEGNTFAMTGGVLTVNANSRGGIFINGSKGNFNVTGGVVVCELDNNNDFLLTSKAPFYNLTVRKTTNNSGYVILDGGTSASGSSDPRTLAAQDLVVLNDLLIQNSSASYVDFDGDAATTGYHAVFNANSVDMYLSGNLTEEVGATFTAGANTITFQDAGTNLISFDPASNQTLNNITIKKNFHNHGLKIAGGNTTSAISLAGELRLELGKLFYQTFNVEAQGNIYLADTVGQSGSTGKLLINGGSAQSLETDGNGAIYNLELNNSNGLSLDGDLAIEGTLTMINGVLDVNTDLLTLKNTVSGSGFGTTKMIQTDGNSSDEGVAFYVDGLSPTESLLFPLGTDKNTARYTPVTANLSGIDNDGVVRIRVADGELPTVNQAALSNNLLTYFWRVSHTGFADGSIPQVDSYVFTAVDSDDPDGGSTPAGLNGNFVPGKVLDELPYTRSQENNADISGLQITFDGSGSGFTLENANYTAGDGTSSLFSGSPTIYYSRATDGNWWEWQETNHWSTDQVNKHVGSPAGSYPGVGAIAVIGSDYVNSLTGGSYSLSGTGRHQLRIDNSVGNVSVAEIIFDSKDDGTALDVTDMSRVRVRGNRTLTAGRISGKGEMVQDIGSTASQMGTVVADLGEFVKDSVNGWFFWFQNSSTVTISDRFEYPIFRTFGSSGTLQFSQDVRARGVIIDNQTSLNVSTNYDIDGQVQIGSNLEGHLIFPNAGSNLTFECGSLVFSNDAGNSISVSNSGTDIHILRVHGNINLIQGAGFDLSSAAGAQVILEVAGGGDHSFSNTTGNIPDLFRLVVNKGVDTTSSFTMQTDFNLSGPTDPSTADSLAVYIQNGKLVLDHSSIDIDLAIGGGDFEVPASGGLELRQGVANVGGDDTGIRLDGLLYINGGTLNMDDGIGNGNNYIEYTSSGSANLQVSSGSMVVGSQIRRSLTSITGVLKYHQTGGDVVLGKNSVPEPTRGVFEIINPGSRFDFTGGTFTVVKGVNSTTVPTLLVEPASYDLTASEIVIGNADTPSGTASSRIGIKSSIPLNSLSINNDSGNNPTVLLYSRPITINGTMDLAAGSSFNSNGYNVTFKGDFNNDGDYIPANNTTTFSAASGTQNYTGTGSSTFYNLVKSGGGTVSLSQDITVSNDFRVLNGIFSHGSSAINVQGNVTIEGTLETTSGSGVVFNGLVQQQLIGKSNVDISLGRITIANAEGVQVPDGNGYSFTIADALRLSQGVFDIGGSLLTINKDAVIEEVNTFSIANMIQTNSSFSDNGVKKIFNGGESSFTFPVGESTYTPLVLPTISTIDEDGYFIVRPANEKHPSVTDDPDTGDDETQNTLQYHWVLKSEGISNSANGTVQFHYDQSDVLVTAPNTESDYVAARLTYDNYQWDKAYAGTAVNTVNNTLTFPLDESANIAGEYTTGIDNAFRDVPEYRSNGDVSFSSPTNWEVSLNGGVDWSSASSVPVGARITVRSGDEVAVDDNNVRLLATTIESGGRLLIDPAYYGTRLGEVDGTGTLVLQNEVFPAGNYENFLACDGGGLEYISANSYPILSGISNVRSVNILGSGTRTMPANAVNICENLVVDGPTLIKSNANSFVVVGNMELISGSVQLSSASASIEIDGSLTLTGGSFSGFNGADIKIGGDLSLMGTSFSPNGADFFFDGSGNQMLSGAFSLKNVTINNTGAGVDLTGGGSLTVSGLLTLTDGLVTTSAGNKLTITSSGSYSGGSTASYINGPITKNAISASATYTFPVGKGGRYAPVTISNVTSGGQNWSSEYFTSVTSSVPTTSTFDASDPGSGYNSLYKIQQNDRWNLTSSGSNSAFIALTYGTHNAFPNTDEIRVTWWDSGDARWENQGGVVTGSKTSGTVVSENAISFSSQEFGLGNAPESLLPVTYTSFIAELVGRKVKLTWQTASEVDNDFFEIERSVDGHEFVAIGSINGNGNSTDLIDYQFYDNSPFTGLSYYRLKQVDFDGRYEYSEVIYIQNNISYLFEANVFPNPASAQNLNVRVLSEDTSTSLSVRLISLNGFVLYSETLELNGYSNEIPLFEKVDLSPGLYLLFLNQGQNQVVERVVVR